MAHPDIHRIGILTSGGDAPGMNAAVRAAVRTARYHHLQTTGILGGYSGMVAGNLRELGPRDVSGILQLGGTFLGTSRCEEFRTPGGRKQAYKHLKAAEIDGLVVVGGDGSYRGALALHEEFGIPVAGVPGTIDNDIGGTDITIGFDTAVNTAMQAIDRLRDTAASHDRIFVVEVMGRACGAIAVASAVAGGAEQVFIPELQSEAQLLRDNIETSMLRGKRSMIVVVAEGDETGGAMEVVKMIKSQFDVSVRASVLGHIQRGGSPSAQDRLLGSLMGARAVEGLLQGETRFMTGRESGQIVTRPIEHAWTHRIPLDPGLLRLCEVLSV